MITYNIILQQCYIVIIDLHCTKKYRLVTKTVFEQGYHNNSSNNSLSRLHDCIWCSTFCPDLIFLTATGDMSNEGITFWKMCSEVLFHPFEWINKQGIMMIKDKMLTQLIKLVFNIHNAIPSPIKNQLQTAASMSHI